MLTRDNDARYRSEANELFKQARQSFNDTDWPGSVKQNEQAINILTQIPCEFRTDNDYVNLTKYHHNLALSYQTMASNEYSLEKYQDAAENYKKALEMSRSIKNPTLEDHTRVSRINSLIFDVYDCYYHNGPVNDEFDECCEEEIAKLNESANNLHKGEPAHNEYLRCLARWTFGLSKSLFRDDHAELLTKALALLNEINVHTNYDVGELALYHLSFARICKDDGQLLDASSHGNKAIELLRIIKDKINVVDDIESAITFLNSLGDNPQNRKKEASALMKNNFWHKMPYTDQDGKSGVMFVPSLLLNK